MKIIDYLNAKYGRGSFCLLKKEAKVFGIPYPLEAGWVQAYGDREIDPAAMDSLIATLCGLAKCNKIERRNSAIRGLYAIGEAPDPQLF